MIKSSYDFFKLLDFSNREVRLIPFFLILWRFLCTSHDHLQNIWEKLWFSCEIAHYRKSSISVFREIFVSTDKILISGGGTEHQAIILWRFEIFLIFSNFLRSLVLSQSASREANVYTRLLLIILLRFSCGETKICSTIKKPRNIMNMIASLHIISSEY